MIFENFRVPGVMKNLRKLKCLIFVKFYVLKIREKLKCLIFVKFHLPGVIEIWKNWRYDFREWSWKLEKTEAGSWKFKKTEVYDFCEFSCTRGHENSRKLKGMIFENFHVLGVMKIWENWSVWFLWTFMYRGSWKLQKTEAYEQIEASDFCEVSHTWKFKKIEASDFCEISCSGGHENSRKLKHLNFVKFHVVVVDPFIFALFVINGTIFTRAYDLLL